MRSVGRLRSSMDYHKEPNSFLPPIKSNKDISDHTKYIPKDLKDEKSGVNKANKSFSQSIEKANNPISQQQFTYDAYKDHYITEKDNYKSLNRASSKEIAMKNKANIAVKSETENQNEGIINGQKDLKQNESQLKSESQPAEIKSSDISIAPEHSLHHIEKSQPTREHIEEQKLVKKKSSAKLETQNAIKNIDHVPTDVQIKNEDKNIDQEIEPEVQIQDITKAQDQKVDTQHEHEEQLVFAPQNNAQESEKEENKGYHSKLNIVVDESLDRENSILNNEEHNISQKPYSTQNKHKSDESQHIEGEAMD